MSNTHAGIAMRSVKTKMKWKPRKSRL